MQKKNNEAAPFLSLRSVSRLLPEVHKRELQQHNQHKSMILWFTGLSGSGKSTLSAHLQKYLHDRGVRTCLLDGDKIRTGLCNDLGFSPEDRRENIRRVGEISKLFVDVGIVVLAAFISPYQFDRLKARALVGDGEFVEVYIKCSLETCEERDVKGLYHKARNGELKDFTGISAPYEAPENPEIVIDTGVLSEEESIQKIVTYIDEQKQFFKTERNNTIQSV